MRFRLIAKLVLFGLLASMFGILGMAVDRNPSRQEGSGSPRVFTTSDCTFFKEGPERFVNPESQHRAQLSSTTQWLSDKRGHPIATGDVTRKNFIDNYIFDKMGRDGVPPAHLSTDAEFIRRVMLDLTGRIPTSSDVRTFVASTSPTKRDDLVNSLIGTPEFVDRWTMFFGDLFKNTAAASNVNRFIDGRTAFYNYIKDSLSQNKPYNQIAIDLITAGGDSFQNGPANFVVGGVVPMGPVQDTYDGQWVQTANVFLGINVFDCLLCHSGAGHLNLVNVWGASRVRMDAWHMSAFYSRTGLQTQVVSQQPNIRKWLATDRASGNYQLGTTSGNRVARVDPNGSTTVDPLYIFNGSAPSSGSNFRAELARNLTGDLQFARAAVNYLWGHFFGIGLVDPPNTFDLARLDPNNPPPAPWTLQPTHPELLTALAQEFVRSGYNLQDIMKLITQSSAYQLSSDYDPDAWSEAYVPYFARHFVRRLDAEEIHDAIAKATGIAGNYSIQTTFNGTAYATMTVQWAMQLPDTTEPGSNGAVRNFLNMFLRGDRDQKLRSNGASIIQALGLMNNNFVLSRIHNASTGGTSTRVAQLLNSSLSNEALLDELFLSTLGRLPTSDEKSVLLGTLAGSSNRASTVEDIQWALINKVDFMYNY
ncbi:MAG: DUF1549 and DUF1553 domain-containing protein [Acidobacteriia bacterium]|nr:DUF1549 and DUF1553 domain-containing protein [Terriglobia bacterium]